MIKRRLILSASCFIILFGLVAFGYWQYSKYQDEISWIESENNELLEKIEVLESEIDELQYELEESFSEKEQYQLLYSENNITVTSDIEYGLLKKYGLTRFIIPEEKFDTFKQGELRVKFRVNNYKEYSELLQAKQRDYFMKYVTLLNRVYEGNGLDHFYDFYPY